MLVKRLKQRPPMSVRCEKTLSVALSKLSKKQNNFVSVLTIANLPLLKMASHQLIANLKISRTNTLEQQKLASFPRWQSSRPRLPRRPLHLIVLKTPSQVLSLEHVVSSPPKVVLKLLQFSRRQLWTLICRSSRPLHNLGSVSTWIVCRPIWAETTPSTLR